VLEPALGSISWVGEQQCNTPLDLCRSAYTSRRSEFIHILAQRGTYPTYGSHKDAIQTAFRMIRHSVGRLGYDTLVSCAQRLSRLLHDFQICSVPIPAKSVMPLPDRMTRLDKILLCMLPANSPELGFYTQALTDMESRYQLFTRYMVNYAKPSHNSGVHAEIQVLEHFYTHKMQFVCEDAFIACSKRACFCCFLYNLLEI
jgi:hypothetical protein